MWAVNERRVVGIDPLKEAKIRASLLMKALLSPDASKARAAAERFRQSLPEEFGALSPEQILALREQVQRKHALAVVAKEQGYSSWAELKAAASALEKHFDPERFFVRHGGAYLNRWFASYEEARSSLRANGGFLFPFHGQFFVCESGFLTALGIDVGDPDWARMGFNWVEPVDPEAKARLEQKLVALGFGS